MKFAKKSLKSIVKKMGYRIVSESAYHAMEAKSSLRNLWSRLENARNLGFAPKCVLDGGANIGLWSKQILKEFNTIDNIIIIEPNPNLIDSIKKNISDYNIKHTIFQAAIGEKHGSSALKLFEESFEDNAGASLLNHVELNPKKIIETEILTIDEIVKEMDIIPDLIKLDLQGFELQALKGAESILGKTEMIISECGFFEAYENRTLPQDLFEFLFKRGYRLYDIVDISNREFDNATGWCDFIFVNQRSELIQYQGFYGLKGDI